MKTNGDDLINAKRSEDYVPEEFQWCGLTKREYFASSIMATLASDWHHYFLTGSQSNAKELVAERAVQLADALIAELNKECGD